METFTDGFMLGSWQQPASEFDDDYLEKWTKIALEEKLQFFKKKSAISIFESFPHLTQPNGHELWRVIKRNQMQHFRKN